MVERHRVPEACIAGDPVDDSVLTELQSVLNLADCPAVHAARWPDSEAIVMRSPDGTTERLTWSELDGAVSQTAAALDTLGAQPGQRLVISSPSSIEFMTAYLGGLRMGMVVVPVNPELTSSELRNVLNHCGASILLTTERTVTPVGPALPGLETLDLGGDWCKTADGRMAPGQVPDPEALALLIYTSGTSGSPKAAMLSHRAILAGSRCLARSAGLMPSDSMLMMLPMFHIYGVNAGLGASMQLGSRVVVTDGFCEDLVELVETERVTHISGTPSVLYRMLALPGIDSLHGRLRRISTGAAPLPLALAEAAGRHFGITVGQGYGLTESVACGTLTAPHPMTAGSDVGTPMPGVEIRIDRESERIPAAAESLRGRLPDEAGEVLMRGEMMFSGYWPDSADAPDADGWFPTGDIGRLVPTEGPDGVTSDRLHLLDRASSVIAVSGFNVYPAEVEAVILDHPGVDDVGVIGRADEMTGERVVAFCVGRPAEAIDLQAYCVTRMARYKTPTRVIFVESIPRLSAGKIDRRALREMLDRMEEAEEGR